MSKFIDLTGKRYGRLLIMKRVANKRGRTCWLCKCDCGNFKEIVGVSITSNLTKSCGCFEIENRYKHGLSDKRLYKIHHGMMSRCYNSSDSRYKDYGGRGISVCENWKNENGLQSFYDWAICNGYSDDLTLDRKNVNENYSPDNCRWATVTEQNNNKRNNRLITINSITRTVTEWAAESNISPMTIRSRLRAGWNETDLLMPPKSKIN